MASHRADRKALDTLEMSREEEGGEGGERRGTAPPNRKEDEEGARVGRQDG
jgi:hypothetical protein